MKREKGKNGLCFPIKCPVCGRDHRVFRVAAACFHRARVVGIYNKEAVYKFITARNYIAQRFGRVPQSG